MAEPLLDQMARASRVRADAALALRDRESWRELSLTAHVPPDLRLSTFDLIAECKLRAPSAGRLAAADIGADDLVRRARAYSDAGVAAISVLTEPARFDGALEHLTAVSSAVGVPAMRKDFLVDTVQVHEARAAGAGGVLLITRMLEDAALGAMLDAARECGLFALVECFDREDCERTSAAVADRDPARVLVGVNSRDLRTLEIRPERLAELAAHLPAGFRWVAESGMHTPDDVAAAAGHGYRLALVGTALMRAADPGRLATQMRQAGTSA